MILGTTQYSVLNYLTNLAPVGETIETNVSKIKENTNHPTQDINVALDALARMNLIQKVDKTHFIVQSDISTMMPRKQAGEHSLSNASKLLLDALVKMYPIDKTIKVPVTILKDKTGLRNSNNLRMRMEGLHAIGAIEILRFVDGIYTLVVKHGIEAFTHTPAPRTKKEAQSNAQVKVLVDRIAVLEETIRQMTMAKPVCWLYKVKGASNWKDTTFDPPTKEDMKELEFSPLYDIAPLLNAAQLEVYTHLKTQGDYHKLGEFIWEATSELSTLYRSIQTGQQFGRVSEIFNDGRFQKKETQ